MSLAATQFPRLLANLPVRDAMSMSAHEALHGPLAAPPRTRSGQRRSGNPLIAELERAGLRGHGGAGFPTATKINAVAAQGSRPVVVVNATEGEPLSEKDSLLMRRLPQLVLDGALAAASLLRSDRLVIALDEQAGDAAEATRQALAERPELMSRRGERPGVTVALLPGGYLTGQETALVSAIDGGPAKPRATPPYPFERGSRGRPTLVSNAETFAQIGLIARYGAEWFRALGTATAPGTRLVSVTGAVSHPGVVEMAGGTSLRGLLAASGGLTEPLRGVLLGGYAGTWLAPEEIGVVLDDPALRDRGLRLGAGIVFALPESACVVAEVAHVTRWLWEQSAGQCGPCLHGLGSITHALESLCVAGDRLNAYRNIERWCGLVTGRGACALPDGAASFVTSALRVFRPAFDDHARHGACSACATERWLPTQKQRALTYA